MTNQQISNIFLEMAALYDIEGISFKPRAYEKAAEGVASFDEDAGALYTRGGTRALEGIPGVGKGIAANIEQLLKTGSFTEYTEYKKKIPVDIAELTAVEGVGPRMVKVLWDNLKVKSLKDLERVARAGKIKTLEGFGEKSEQRILKGIEFLKRSGGRQILGFVLGDAAALEQKIRGFLEVERAVVAGSIRRRKETIGDIDIVVVSKKPEAVMKQFVALPEVAHVYARGKTKTLVQLANGMDADLRVVPARSFGAALNYFTGSKAHNVKLREIAIQKGWKLNEYGIFKVSAGRAAAKKETYLAGKDEEGLYTKLGLAFIEPELREDTGEIEAAIRQAQGKRSGLPKLINRGELKGDLQIQTDWTDGAHSIEEMARAAREHGLEYIAITDHTKSLAMTGGADEKKLLRQIAAIEKINRRLGSKKFRILTGAEVNIQKDGTLDIHDDVLARLEVVGVAVHSHFKLSRKEQTKRVVRAMENPHVDIVFHLTGRLLNRREAIDIDVDEIIRVAKRTGTVLEINASPSRADLKDEYIRKCVGAGVNMTIDSDAHAREHFAFLDFGIAEARRGWAAKTDIINTLPVEKFLKKLK